MNDASVSIRGTDSYLKPATRRRRWAAVVLEFPLHLLTPVIGVLAFGQSPLPGIPGLAVWIAAGTAIHFLPRRWFQQTWSERLLGIRRFAEQGVLQKRASDRFFQLRAKAAVLISTAISVTLLAIFLQHHPLFQRAKFHSLGEPETSVLDGGIRLPFFFVSAQFPRSIAGQTIWFELPYAKGPPERFAPRVIAHLSNGEGRLTLEGPRTSTSLSGRRDRIRSCLNGSWLQRFAPDCGYLRRELIQRHADELYSRLGGVEEWSLGWFEKTNHTQSVIGIWITAKRGTTRTDRAVVIGADGRTQSLTLERAPAPVLERLLSSLDLHTRLEEAQAVLDDVDERTNLAAIRGGGTLEKLSHAQMLLVSKASVFPDDEDTYFELATLSALILKRTQGAARHEAVTAVARRQARAAQLFMRDVAPDDARNPQLEQLLSGLR